MTRELGSRWVPHPASGTASTQNESPLPSQARETLRPPPGLPSPSSSSSRPAPRPAARRTRERETRTSARGSTVQAAPLVAASLPHLTAPAPHPRDPPGAARPPPGYTTRRGAGGGVRAAASRSAGGPGDGCGGSRGSDPGVPCGLRHPSPSAPQPAGVGDRNPLPTWRTGSGPARRREHSSLAGSEASGPGARASGGAWRADSGVWRPKWSFRGGNDPEGQKGPSAFPPSPRQQTPRPQVGLRGGG